jgi:octaprenyl-diphosphate synthase
LLARLWARFYCDVQAAALKRPQLDAIAPPQQRSEERSPLERLTGLVRADMDRVDDLIHARMSSDVHMIPELAAHLINAGGKRVRPMITLAAARLCGYEGDHHVKLAATVEFIHTATLLHDDVVDGSGLRRGKTAANLLWGNSASVLVGDFLFSRAFSLMVETDSLKVLGILSNASSIIAEGEVAQLAALNDIETTLDAYMEIIEAKTAALFSAAAEVGAVIAGANPAREAALKRYGLELGLAFQLADDALDYGGGSAQLGKSVGDDFAEGKVTMPVALAIARARSDEERAFWRRTIGAVDQQPEDFAQACDLIDCCGAIEDTLKAAQTHADAAVAALTPFEDGEIKEALGELCGFVVSRAY